MSRHPDPRPPDPDRAGRRSRCLPAVLVAAVVLAAAGCGSGGPGDGGSAASADTTTPTAAADTGTTGRTTTVPAPAGDGTTTPPIASSSSSDDGGGAGAPADGCAETRSWGTEPRSAEPMSVEDVYLVRPGRHDCFDRVVFDVNGVIDGPDAVGFHVAYVQGDVLADASGEPVPTAGDAALEVVVRAPAQGYGTTGHQPGRAPARVGDDLVTAGQVGGWPALREVTFAGSFEGQTTYAVGVDGQLPFRVGSYEADGYTHVYVDIAHAP